MPKVKTEDGRTFDYNPETKLWVSATGEISRNPLLEELTSYVEGELHDALVLKMLKLMSAYKLNDYIYFTEDDNDDLDEVVCVATKYLVDRWFKLGFKPERIEES